MRKCFEIIGKKLQLVRVVWWVQALLCTKIQWHAPPRLCSHPTPAPTPTQIIHAQIGFVGMMDNITKFQFDLVHI